MNTQAIPAINLQALLDDSPEGIKIVAEQLKNNFAEIGFAYLTNHGVSNLLIKSIFEESKKFHNLPLEAKLKIKHNDSFRGYMPNKSSQVKISTEGFVAEKPNLVESFVIMFEAPEDHPDYQKGVYFAGPNQWPENYPDFKKIICEYRDAMLKLSYRLLKSFSVALGMDPHGLDSLFTDPTYILRLQHYLKQETVDQFGIAPHTDFGFITLLAQDNVGGLEIKLTDGRWIGVPYIPNTFVLNAGALLSRLSNDIFRAIPHRVMSQSCERYSIPFFFDMNMHATVDVLKSCITPERPAHYAPIHYGDHLVERAQKNYGLGKRKA